MNAMALVKMIAVAGGGLLVIQQVRKPTWWLGQLTVMNMNSRHRRLTLWGLDHLTFEPRSTVLDVGCGGGKTIEELARRAPEGKVYGIDYAGASVAVARRTNAALIAAGRVDVRKGTVSKLPYEAEMFDVVTAVETHYYWPDLVADLRETLRVLKPGGRIAIIAETYRDKAGGAVEAAAMRLLGSRLLTAAQHGETLRTAGFAEVEIHEDRDHGWLCVIGARPRNAEA
jgi:SAM-dependent methyltransferase